jgi:hypothetical protein
MRIALAQIDCSLGDIDKNLPRAKEVLAQARDAGADLTVRGGREVSSLDVKWIWICPIDWNTPRGNCALPSMVSS